MDKVFILPHTHYDAEVFLTREVYLEVGYKVIIDALNLLKRDPDYRYCLDQSAFVDAFLKAYPELAGTFREMVRQGRLEIVGGMYVMADLNMVCGESIVRQFEFGKGSYRREPGVEVRTGWMIDTFGQSMQMPQIMRGCGFDSYFFARVARVDVSEFLWQGIDGTRIPTHWMPGHYCVFSGSPSWFPGFRSFAEDRYSKLKPFAATSVLAAPEGGDFTHPVRHDPPFVREWNADPERPFDLVIGTPGEFMDEVLRAGTLEVVEQDFNPVFQGVYSARIRIKQQNRLLEGLLNEGEVWNAMSALAGCADRSHQLRDAWEPVLFNQVHDILGGVQMDNVFEGVMKRYVQAGNLARLVREESLDHLADRIDTRGEGIPVTVFNPLCWERTDLATVDVAYDEDDTYRTLVLDSRGSTVPAQVEVLDYYPNGAVRQARILFQASLPGLGHEVFRVCSRPAEAGPPADPTRMWKGSQESDEASFENEYYRIRFDCWKGSIRSLVLKENGEELIDPSMPYGNMLVQEEDQGDFWEIGAPLRAGSNHPVERLQPLDLDGPQTRLSIRKGGTCSIRMNEVVSEFTFVQTNSGYEFSTTVRLQAGVRRIEIESTLLNRQRNVRYRIAFPSTVREGTITHSIPFGSLERQEGEFPALDWTDFSEPGKGLGLLNCGLPGNGVVDGKVLLSLMKCTSFVSYGEAGGFSLSNSSEAGHEIGVPHRFRYAIVPHGGDWRATRLHRQGAELNHPFVVRKSEVHAGELPTRWSFVDVGDPRVCVSSLRRIGQDFELRIYETTGATASGVRIALGRPILSVQETNLLGDLKETSGRLESKESHLVVDLKPYEIRTFRIG